MRIEPGAFQNINILNATHFLGENNIKIVFDKIISSEDVKWFEVAQKVAKWLGPVKRNTFLGKVLRLIVTLQYW